MKSWQRNVTQNHCIWKSEAKTRQLWTFFCEHLSGWRPKVCILPNSLWSSLPNSLSQVENQRKSPLGDGGELDGGGRFTTETGFLDFVGKTGFPERNFSSKTRRNPNLLDAMIYINYPKKLWFKEIETFQFIHFVPCLDAMSCWPLDVFFFRHLWFGLTTSRGVGTRHGGHDMLPFTTKSPRLRRRWTVTCQGKKWVERSEGGSSRLVMIFWRMEWIFFNIQSLATINFSDTTSALDIVFFSKAQLFEGDHLVDRTLRSI